MLPVEVALVLVLLARVMFAKLVAPVKVLKPEKVLLFARRVEDAAVIAELQPKEPFAYETA